MKKINTLITLFSLFLMPNMSNAESYQQLALLTEIGSSLGKSKAHKTVPKRKRSGWSCLSNMDIIKRKALEIDHIIMKNSRRYSVDGNLIRAVIAVESCYNSRAVSPAGAQGLMQLIPATAERFGVNNSFDIEQNIKAGTKYLRFLLKRYDGDLKKVTAGYNAGEGRVDQYNGVPPYKETRNYVKNVLRIFGHLSGNPELASLVVIEDALVNKKPEHYQGMSAADQAILNRIRAMKVKSSFPLTKKKSSFKKKFTKKNRVRHKNISVDKRTALHKILQIKPSYKRNQLTTGRRLSSLNRIGTLRKKSSLTKRLENRARALPSKPGRRGWNVNRQLAPQLYRR